MGNSNTISCPVDGMMACLPYTSEDPGCNQSECAFCTKSLAGPVYLLLPLRLSPQH